MYCGDGESRVCFTFEKFSVRLGVEHSCFFQWRKLGGIPLKSADRLVSNLGYHLVDIWPDWYEVDRVITESHRQRRRMDRLLGVS